MTAGLSACSGTETDNLGQIGAVQGFLGGVVADEPRAVRTARDVLSAGGTAADAAVALYMTMTVTKPSVAGIGGGGVCIVHDRASKKVEVLDFWPRPGTRTAPQQIQTAVPGVPRGLYALNARYGRLQWGQLVAGAEQQARFGVPVSRSLAADIESAHAQIAVSPLLSATYIRNGKLIGLGDRLEAINLGALLTSLRVKGPGDFYNGALASQIVNSVQAEGGTLTLDDLRQYAPVWREAASVKVGNEELYFANPPRTGAGAPQVIGGGNDLSAMLDRYLADIRQQGDNRAVGQGRSGFVVVDRNANAVACQTTMNAPFGSGIGANAIGLNLASGEAVAAQQPLIGPALLVNPFVFEYRYGIAGSGTPAGATKQIATIASDLIAANSVSGLAANDNGQASVNVIRCLQGIPPHPESCEFVADPAGFGMAGR
ncbi:gamma-glutamyltransferase [Thalassospira sp.]|uniref:gamma-glutamyltransferase n=1 Tax=Thalassospira sp. TaxID=1912094 RepID=UPI002735BB4D|nr:gamma-glutamyltransferase [Thalassospira sp.]MDP2700117.1 gamma-glutamyltransferase [Thalassospira sp.]